MAEVLALPGQLALWHSGNWRWVRTVPYVLVPPGITLAWCALRLRRRGVPREEVAVGVGTVLGVAAYVWMQFAGSVATLEYHIYSSMLWAGVCLSTAFLIVGMSGRLLARPATAAVPAGLMLAAAVGWSLARADVHVTLAPAGLLIAAALVVVAVLGVVARRHRGLAGLAVAGVVVADLVLTAAPTGHPSLADTTGLPHGHYDTILGHPHTITVDQYAVASRLHTIVPPAKGPVQEPMEWWPPAQSPIINMVAAQYLWRHLPNTMPDLARGQPRIITAAKPSQMLFFSLTGREFPAALTALRHAGDQPRVQRRATLRSGAVIVHVWVLVLRRFVRG